MGANGLLKAFSTMPKYTGRFKDELQEVIEAFETLFEVSKVTTDENTEFSFQ